MKNILVIGIPRSGTTVLASMLGGHSQISMLDESYTKDMFKLVGTKYIGNKIACDGMVINYYRKRMPILGAIINRIVNIPFKSQLIRFFPIYNFKLQDFDPSNTIVFITQRNKKDIIKSNVLRGKMPLWIANLKYSFGMYTIKYVEKRFNPYYIFYEDLINNPEPIMKAICEILDIPIEIDNMINGSQYNNRYSKKIIK